MKATPAGFTKKKVDGEITRAKLTKGLNTGQADAFMLIRDFIADRNTDDMFVLKGYGGTGKTYLVKRVIEYINKHYSGSKIAVTAPTNKAVQVLKSKNEFKSWNIAYQTIHSLLGLTETITADGRVIFTDKNGNNSLSKFKFLIIDEVSMLQDEIFNMIRKYSSTIKIILMGDPAQIPPVGKDDCLPFKISLSRKYEEGYTLTEIMRQAKGNPIVEASFAIRENLTSENPVTNLRTDKDHNGHGLVWLNSETDRDELLHQLEAHFTSALFKLDPDYAKVIAWRNRSVDTVNSKIRHMIYGPTLQKIMPGEKLLANSPIFSEDMEIIFNTSEEFQIASYQIVNKTKSIGGMKFTGKVYECRVNKGALRISQNNNQEKIFIIHEDSEKDYADFLTKLKERAIKSKGQNKNAWVDYYEAVKWPANIAYNYAITAHKSQGSTYVNVFVMEDDLDMNRNIVERNRIKYTAYSRASQTLFVYKKPS